MLNSNLDKAGGERPRKEPSEKESVVVAIKITSDEKEILDSKAGLVPTATFVKHHLRAPGGLFDFTDDTDAALASAAKKAETKTAGAHAALESWSGLGGVFAEPYNAQEIISVYARASSCSFEDALMKAAHALLDQWRVEQLAKTD